MTEHILKQKERQLSLLAGIDRIRDTVDHGGSPQMMFGAIASLLKRHFHCDAVAIMLIDDETQTVEALAANSVPDDMALELCKEAIHYDTPQSLEKAVWQHTLGVQIVLDNIGSVVGSFFVARNGIPLNDDDVELLTLAESQIDSAVMQARNMWKLAERNRELEAIFQIDHLRDSTPDEMSLLDSFLAVILKHYEANFCIAFVEDEQYNEILIRGSLEQNVSTEPVILHMRMKAFEVQSPQQIPAPMQLEPNVLLAAPLKVSSQPVGAILVGREKAFSISDHRLMYAMVSQMDSAIVKHRIARQLDQRNRELEAIYRIDRIRDQDTELDIMLTGVLEELCNVVACEMGYIMLYNEETAILELMGTTASSSVKFNEQFESIIHDYSRQALTTEDVIYDNAPDNFLLSIVSIPLILKNKIIGVFGAINSSHKNGFSKDDRRMLTAITSQVDTAVFERLERRRMRQVLSRSVDPKVLEALLQRADDKILAGERVILTVLFADLRGSTEWTERTEPEVFVDILNQFLEEMTNCIFKHGGTLDKFVGDEIIALFGTPIPMEDHAYHAARTALEMKFVQQKLIEELAGHGRELPPMGIGIASGEVIAGEFGPPFRTDFTAMGRVMNLGSRLCGEAQGHQIIISPNTYAMLGKRFKVTTLSPVQPKGIGQPVQVYELLGES